MMKYLELYGIDYKNLTERPCHQKFTFGSSKYLSEEIVEVPITMKTNEGKHVSFAEATYILKDSNTPFLLGKKTLKVWKAQINIADDELNIKINDNGKLAEKVIPMIDGSHPMVELQTESDDEEVVHYVNDNWNDISTYKGVKKVHKVHGHKSEKIFYIHTKVLIFSLLSLRRQSRGLLMIAKYAKNLRRQHQGQNHLFQNHRISIK